MTFMIESRRTTMRAAVHTSYGSLEIRDVEVPTPGDREVLVRVRAAGVDPGTWFTFTGRPYLIRLVMGLRRPRRPVLGRAIAGEVAAVGSGATSFRPGDEVYAELAGGAYAEYVVAKASALAAKPAGLSFEAAAAVPVSATTALQGIRDAGRVTAGDHVLVNGASGGVGTFAVQVAKALGAEVTAVCSARNAGLLRSIGADHVVDYAREDVTRSGRRYDVVLDLVGNHSLAGLRRALAPRGTLVLSAGPPAPTLRRLFAALALSPFTRQRLVPLAARVRAADLEAIAELVEAGSVTPVLDRTYPLADVAAALHRQGDGHARGKTVVTTAE